MILFILLVNNGCWSQRLAIGFAVDYRNKFIKILYHIFKAINLVINVLKSISGTTSALVRGAKGNARLRWQRKRLRSKTPARHPCSTGLQL